MYISNLYKVRLSRGYTQRQLAEASGVSIVTIQKYENRQRIIEKADLSIVLALASVLRVPIYNILEDREMAIKLYKTEKEAGII